MTPNLLKIIWFFLPACWLAVGLLTWPQLRPPLSWGLLALSVLFLLGWGYLSVRVFSFRKRLLNFMRLLLAGDYEAGIRTKHRFDDDVSHIETLANKLAERLRTYDRLRADRVSIHARVLDLVLLRSKEALISANVEKGTFLFNPAAQKLLGISRKSYSFESVLKPTTNATFKTLFDKAVEGRKVNTEGVCILQLPGMKEPQRIGLFLMPLRDRDENVRFALISINPEEIDVPITP